jgi:hypothetical protein
MPRKATRVAVLVVLLAITAMWAVGRTTARRARTSWAQPVRIAVLVLGDASPAAMDTLRVTLEALSRRLAEVRAAWQPDASGETFSVELVGPLHVERPPPVAPPDPDPLARALHAFDLWRAARDAHAAAPDFVPGAWDVRIYLVAAAPDDAAPRFAEGLGEQGGELGVVRARFDEGGALLAAAAVFHEAFHCLGATDKYDLLGHARMPDGLAEPDLVPRFPQRMAELMVGEIPLGPLAGRLPTLATEIGVGPVTAAEVGWLPPVTATFDPR